MGGLARCFIVVTSVLSGAAACGGASSNQADGPNSSARVVSRTALVNAEVSPEPLEVAVNAQRLGDSLHLEIVGTGRGRLEGERFEDPQYWKVEVKQAGASLRRTVNGPVSVARDPVGKVTSGRWDVVVKFSIAFEMEGEQLPLHVMVHAPSERPANVTISKL